MFNNLCLHQLDIHLVTQLLLKACHALIDKAARVDVVKILQVGVHIHRKAVHRNIAARSNTYGTYLSCSGAVAIKPYARCACNASCLDAPLAAYANDRLLQRVNILTQTYAQLLQVEDGVAHHLTRTVVGDVATSVDVIEFGTYRTQVWLRDEHILALATLAQCVNRIVFYKIYYTRSPDLLWACDIISHLPCALALQHTIKHSTLLLPALKVAHSPQVFVQYLLHFSQKLAPK